jgi:hypothetical protein
MDEIDVEFKPGAGQCSYRYCQNRQGKNRKKDTHEAQPKLTELE